MPRPIGAVGMLVIVQLREHLTSSQQCVQVCQIWERILVHVQGRISCHLIVTTDVKRPPFFGTAIMGTAQALFETFWIMPSFFVQLLPNYIFDGKGNWPRLVKLRNCVWLQVKLSLVCVPSLSSNSTACSFSKLRTQRVSWN